MALWHRFLKSMKDNRGSGTFVFGVLFFVPFAIFSIFLIESKLLYIQKSTIDDAVVSAGLAALKSPNLVDIAYGEYKLDPSLARDVFNEYLKKNLKLDNNFNPLPGSVAIAPVKVKEFVVYNPEDLPTECPNGTAVRNTTIHVVVSARVKRPALRGLYGDEVEIVVHRDIDNYYTLEHLEMGV